MRKESVELLPQEKHKVALDTNGNERGRADFEMRHRFVLKGRCSGVRSVNVTSDDRYLIITFEQSNERIRVVDLETLQFLPHTYEGHTDSVRMTSITRDNKAFVTASWDGSSRRFDIVSGKCTQMFSGFGRCPSCFLDPEQNYLFTASYDSDIDLESNNTGRCWELVSGKLVNVYKHTDERISPESMAIAYDDGRVYTGSDDGVAYKWDVEGEKPILKFFAVQGSIRNVRVSANYFAAACTDGFVRVHNKFSGKCLRQLFLGNIDVRDVRISKDETKVWSATADGSISCFNLMTGELMYQQRPHQLWIWSICLMRDEKILVTGSSDGSVAFLSADSGQVLARLLNVRRSDDMLITCPPDAMFPTGLFFTSNKDFIRVVKEDKKKGTEETLDKDDPRREAYISKRNLKHLVITRLKNNGHYTSLTNQSIENQKSLRQTRDRQSQRLLMA